VRHFWPGLTPSREPNTANPVNEPYLRDIRSSRLSFYAYLVACAENYELLSGVFAQQKSFAQLCLSYRHAFIGELNRELQGMTEPSDDLLGAIIVLAGNAVMFAGQERLVPLRSLHVSRFRSPLSTAQFINVYSARPFASPHTEALVRLTVLKGGLSQVTHPGVSNVLALWAAHNLTWCPERLANVGHTRCDLVHGSQTNTPALLHALDPPPLNHLKALRDLTTSIDAFQSGSLQTWHKLAALQPHREELLGAVEALLLVNDALEEYVKARPVKFVLADLVNARNDLQSLVLSLPTSSETPQTEVCNPDPTTTYLYEIARIGLRIYSNLVTFPMNPAGGTSQILCAALRGAIQHARRATLWQLLQRESKMFLIWILILGGLQAEDDPNGLDQDEEWFLEGYVALSSSVGITTWPAVKDCLLSFVWSESILSTAAHIFWEKGDRRRLDREKPNAESVGN
jgi:hypothetical protein